MTKLTETTASALNPGKTIRDHRFKGLMAIGRKGATTYAYQTDLRRNGRFVRTIRVTLGKSTEMSLKEARTAAAKAQEKIRSGIDPNAEATNAKELSLIGVIEDHVRERDLAERTVQDYLRHWTNKKLNTLYPLRNMHPADVTRDDVRALKARLMKRGSTMCGGSLRILRLTLTHAMRLDQSMKENPCAFVVIPATPNRETEPVDLTDFSERVVKLSPMWRTLWTLSLLTAARRASLLAMRRDDVDVENRTIRLVHVKTMRKGATLPIGERMAVMLSIYLSEPSASEWLWPGRINGKPMTNVRLRTFPYATHQLRHNWTSLATAAGVPFMEQRMLMTHALPGMGQVYTDPNALVEHLRQYAQAIEELVFEDSPHIFEHND